MAASPLTPEARLENIRALAAIAGVTEEDASKRLDQVILVNWDAEDPASAALVKELEPILSRTINVDLQFTDAEKKEYAAEIVIGKRAPFTSFPRVFCTLFSDRCVISQNKIRHKYEVPPHPLKTLIAACYLSGAAIRCAVGQDMPNPPPETFEISYAKLIDPAIDLTAPIEIGETYLAGAGAIGNGFVWAARCVDLHGKLHNVDYDKVSSGNLQRQVWFSEADIGEYKAEILCQKAQPFMPNCELVPSVSRLQEHKNRTDGAWLKKLIVAVDSRRARRHLQNELPGEVFDASMTGSREIVLHYNKQPTDQACMGCIYFEDEAELSHDQSVAAHLGIDVSDLQKKQIDETLAARICASHPQLNPAAIVGEAFDSLYKQLCSSGQLRSVKGEQVIAPFAFISVLAGSLLLLEIIRRHYNPSDPSNDWRVNPWNKPFPQMRQKRPRRENCKCCGSADVREAIKNLWSKP